MYKLSGLNCYLKGYIKPMTNKLLKKIINNNYKFSVSKCKFIKDISLSSFLMKLFTENHCVMIETISSNKT